MTNIHSLSTRPNPGLHPIDHVIAQHGALRVMIRALLALARRDRRKPPQPLPVNAHLRRDIGMAPQAMPPPNWDRIF